MPVIIEELEAQVTPDEPGRGAEAGGSAEEGDPSDLLHLLALAAERRERLTVD